jgi:hypothetical protein
MIGIRRLPRRARGFLVVAAAWAITAVAGLVIAGTMTGSGPASAGPARYTSGVRNPIGWDGSLYPLGPPGSGAEKMTVAGAQANVGYPVPMPRTPAASRANLTQAWVSGSAIPRQERAVALVFDNGKVQIIMRRDTYQSALHYFRAFVAEKELNRVTAAIGQVNGRPALVVTPNTSAFNHSNPAVVNFWRNGTLISIYSHAYGTNTLLAIASSIE